MRKRETIVKEMIRTVPKTLPAYKGIIVRDGIEYVSNLNYIARFAEPTGLPKIENGRNINFEKFFEETEGFKDVLELPEIEALDAEIKAEKERCRQKYNKRPGRMLMCFGNGLALDVKYLRWGLELTGASTAKHDKSNRLESGSCAGCLRGPVVFEGNNCKMYILPVTIPPSEQSFTGIILLHQHKKIKL